MTHLPRCLACFVLACLPRLALATAYTWTGGGTTNNWFDTANWSPVGNPGAADTVLFNSGSKNCTLPPLAVSGLQMSGAYSGTLTVPGNFRVYSVLAQSSGTIDCVGGPISVSGLALSNGAVFIEPNLGMAVNGPVTLDSSVSFTAAPNGGIAFQGLGLPQLLQSPVDVGNVDLAGGSLTLTADTQVDNLTLANGAWFNPGGFDLSVAGNWTSYSSTYMSPASGTVTFNGTGAHTLSQNGDAINYFYNLTVNSPGGTLTFNSNLQVSATASVLQGSLIQNGGSTSVVGALSMATNASYTGASFFGPTLSVGPGDLSLATGSSFTESVSGTLLYGGLHVDAGAALNATSGGLVFNDGGIPHPVQSAINLGPVTVQSGSLTLTSDVAVTNFKVNNFGAYFCPGTFTLSVTGNYQDPGGQSSAGTIAFTGTGAQTVDQTNPTQAFLPNVLVSKAAGTLTIASWLNVTGTVTVAQGSLDTGNGEGLVTQGLDVQSGATVNAEGGLQISPGGLLKLEAGSNFIAPPSGTGGGSGGFKIYGGLAVAAGASYTPGLPLDFLLGANQTLQCGAAIGPFRIDAPVTLTANSQISTLQDVGGNGWLGLGPYTLNVSGDWNSAGSGWNGFHDNSGTVVFNGSGAQALNLDQNQYFNNLVVAKPSGAVTTTQYLGVTNTLTVSQGQLVAGGGGGIQTQVLNLAINNGSFDSGNGPLETMPGGLFSVASGAVFIAPLSSNFKIDGSVNFASGAFITPGNQAIFEPGPGNHTLQSGVSVGNVQLQTGVSLAASATVGNVDLEGYGFFGLGPYTLTVDGNWNANNGLPPYTGSGTVVFGGSGAQSITNNSGYPFPNLTVNKPSGALSFQFGFLAVSGTTTVNQGTLNASQGPLQTTNLSVNNGAVTLGSQPLVINPGGTLYVAPNAVLNQGSGGIDCYGSVDFPAGALVTGSGQLRFPYGGQGTLQSAADFGDLVVNGGSVTLSADTVVTNAQVDNGWMSLGGHTLTVLGNWTLNGDGTVFSGGPGNLLFAGTGAQTVDGGFGGSTPAVYSALTVQKPSGILSIANGNVDVGTFNVAQGTFDTGPNRSVNAANLVVQPAGQYTGDSGNLTVSQSLVVQSGGTFSGPTGNNYPSPFQLSGACQILPGAVFSSAKPLAVIPPGLRLTSGVSAGNLLVESGATLTLSADCLVSGVSVTSGAFLNLRGNTLFDSGYFSNQGAPNVGNGTLNLDGTHQQLDGTSQFQNLVKQSAGPDTLCFTQNSQQSVSGDLDLQGLAPGIPLRLRSSNAGQAYQLWAAPVATVQARNLDVEDSNAAAGQALVAIQCEDSGDNHNWIFATATYTVSPTFTASPTDTPTATPTPTYTASPTPTSTVTPTFTASPTATPTPTFTASPTNFYAHSGLGRTVLAPVPAHVGGQVCLYFDKAPNRTHWDLYAFDQTKVASLDFGAQYNQCWSTGGVAPGVYYLKLHLRYNDGSEEDKLQKVMLIP